MDKLLVKKSKFLAMVLRHAPELIELKLDENGWADIRELVSKANSYGMSLKKSDIEIIVAENDKKRFTISDNGDKIRAAQGHSIDIEVAYDKTKPPDFLFHGTATKSLDNIMRDGLKSMDRNHVHLSVDVETAFNVGSRHGKPIILKIDAETAYHDGVNFYLSDNGVWLTEFIDVKYITINY